VSKTEQKARKESEEKAHLFVSMAVNGIGLSWTPIINTSNLSEIDP